MQRYLTAKSVDEARTSLLMSAYWKIPLQALVLIIGVFDVPVLRVHAAADAVQPRARRSRCAQSARSAEYVGAGAELRRRDRDRREAAEAAAATVNGGDAVARAMSATAFTRR